MAQAALRFGQPAGLKFELRWRTGTPARTAAEFSRGELSVELGGSLVWSSMLDGRQRGIEWTWIELLEQLAEAWPYLEWEESDPLGIGGHPSYLRLQAEERWRNQPEKLSRPEEEALWAFENRHDLSMGLGGIHLPSLWVLRRGLMMMVSCRGETIWRPASEILKALEGLGSAIVDRIVDCRDERAAAARAGWQSRRTVANERFIRIATGLSREEVGRLAGSKPLETVFRLSAVPAPNELVAAARMSRRLVPPEVMERILSRIRKLRAFEHDDLDNWGAKARGESSGGRPFEQGYSLASWFRQAFNLESKKKVVVEDVFHRLGVRVIDFEFGTETVDAVAVWGPSHGPAVFVNETGLHAQTKPGRRATLAHELCHLLVDRIGALPLADVLAARDTARGDDVEARARAFAAELLLPRGIASDELRTAPDPIRKAEQLAKRFGVSREIVAWQAKNAPSPPGREILDVLQSLVSERWSY